MQRLAIYPNETSPLIRLICDGRQLLLFSR